MPDRFNDEETAWGLVGGNADGDADPQPGASPTEDEARAVLAQLMVKAAAEGDAETVRKIQAVISDPEKYQQFLAHLDAEHAPDEGTAG